MIAELKFDTITSSRGRNGIINTSGVEVMLCSGEKTLMLSPITSKSRVSNACWIEIPVSSLPAVIAELQKLVPG